MAALFTADFRPSLGTHCSRLARLGPRPLAKPGLEGIVAKLERAIVVGPIARLELLPLDSHQPAGHDPLIEAQIPAQQFRSLGFKDGETLVVSPRKARVFLQGH